MTTDWKPIVDDRVDRVRGLTDDQREDLRQDCYVAMLTAKARMERAGPGGLRKLAAKIVVEQLAVKMKQVWRAAETENVDEIDTPDVVPEGFESMMEGLDDDERAVLTALYVDAKTEAYVAGRHGRSRWWVRDKKMSGLRKIKERMNA